MRVISPFSPESDLSSGAQVQHLVLDGVGPGVFARDCCERVFAVAGKAMQRRAILALLRNAGERGRAPSGMRRRWPAVVT